MSILKENNEVVELNEEYLGCEEIPAEEFKQYPNFCENMNKFIQESKIKAIKE